MQNSQATAEKIKFLAKKQGISISKLLSDCKLNKNAIYTMQTEGYFPRIEAISKIADYLNCSIDDLVGRSNNQSINTGDITNNSGIIGNNNNNIYKSSELSVQEQDILRIYRSSDGKTQMEIMNFIYNIEEKKKVVK